MLPIPFGTDRPRRLFPWMNIALIAANVAIYALSHHAPAPGHLQTITIANLVPGWDKLLLYPGDPHLYQFLSYQFLHENLSHLFFNMLFLWVFGNNLEEKLGHLGYVLFYLTGGVLAGCGHMLTSIHLNPTLGASGSISAVTGMFLVMLPRTNIRIFFWFMVYADVWEIPSVYFILFSVAKDVFETVFWHGTGVAYAAHLAGNLSGFAIGLLLLGLKLVQRDHYDLLAVFGRWRRRKQYESVVATGYNPFGPGSQILTPDAAPAKPVNPRIEGLRMEIGELVHRHALPQAAEKYLELRKLEPTAILGMDDQLDVANQLMSERRYPEAAAAYEDFVRVYSISSQHEQVMLVLGLVYAQHLNNPERAVELYKAALVRLHDEKQREFARGELERLEKQMAPPPP